MKYIEDLDLNECTLKFGKYINGRIQFSVVTLEGEQICCATLNCAWHSISDKEVIIKDYQENEGIYDILFAANVVSKVKRRISVGLHKAYVCDLLIKPKFKYVR